MTYDFDFTDWAPGSVLTNFMLSSSPANIWDKTGKGAVFGTGFVDINGTTVTNGQAEMHPAGHHPSMQGQYAEANRFAFVYTAPRHVTLSRLAFRCVDAGGSANLSVNGRFLSVSDMHQVDGVDFDGALASVAVDSSVPGDPVLTVTLTGVIYPKNFFGHVVFGGAELLVDRVTCDEA